MSSAEPTSTESVEEDQSVSTPEPEHDAADEAVEAAEPRRRGPEVEVEVPVARSGFRPRCRTGRSRPSAGARRPSSGCGCCRAPGTFRLNGKTLEQYFPNKLHQQLIREPLVTVEKTERFDIFANLQGGGTSGQAGALRLAIARALIEADSEDRPPLKKAGFLTRDPRVIERKKYGLKKARKAPQYSKR